jgi:hypothetical protein
MKYKSDDASDRLSRRSILLEGVASAAGIAVALAASTNAAMANKLPQKSVSYRDAPNAGKKCSECALFEPPKACKNVAGDISPNGWCVLWRAK